jgi:hypothetical protein
MRQRDADFDVKATMVALAVLGIVMLVFGGS